MGASGIAVGARGDALRVRDGRADGPDRGGVSRGEAGARARPKPSVGPPGADGPSGV